MNQKASRTSFFNDTVEKGFVYLAVIMDLFSRKIIGWALDTTMTNQLIIDAFTMAVKSRNAEPGLILHSDRGVQYRSGEYQALLLQEGILQRLADKGFASCNVVLGIGSYTYQYVTRDTHGSAVKATNITMKDGTDVAIFKDPKTGGGEKKSAKGLLMVKDVDGVPTLFDNVSREEEQSEENMLQTVWEDGKFVKTTTIYEIRERVAASF